MHKVQLGQSKTDTLDVTKLIESRLLIQANSGGGKSHTTRRLLEQTHGLVQQIVLDPEGEFSTLRERYDYVLVGRGGDLPADPRSAALLAVKLLETKVSAIIDLYELPAQDRKRFVRLFLDAMVNADKRLWHPCLVILDEAHVFVPEHGDAESAGAVIDLCTRGRKRGFCAVLATQRLSKLHKDAAAECNNKLIGRTGLDIDMKRAGDELGFGRDRLFELRNLEPGEFFAYGPAISREVVRVKIGPVATSHPRIGHVARVTKPTDAVRAALAKLGDLPKEAEEEARTNSELRAQVAELKRHRCPKVEPSEVVSAKVESLAKSMAEKMVESARKDMEDIACREVNRLAAALEKIGEDARGVLAVRTVLRREFKHVKLPLLFSGPLDPNGLLMPGKITAPMPRPFVYHGTLPEKTKPKRDLRLSDVAPTPLGGRARLMVAILAARPNITRDQLALHACLVNPSGNFSDRLSEIRSRGWLVEDGTLLSLSPSADLAGLPPVPTYEQVLAEWNSKLGGKARMMLAHLIENRGTFITRADLATAVGLVNPSGNFSDRLSELRSKGLVHDVAGGIRVSEDLFV